MTERVTLGDLAARGSLLLNDGYRTRASELGAPGVPILRVAEVQDGRLEPSFGDHVRDEYRAKIGQKLSRAGDVVVTTKGTVGRVARIVSAHPQFVYSPQVCFFRSLDESIDPDWLYYWFRGPEFAAQATSVQGQTDMAAYINLADMRGMGIHVPAVEIQRGIARTLGALDDKIESNRKQIKLALDWLDALAEQVTADGVSVLLNEIASVSRDMLEPRALGGALFDHFSIPAFDTQQLPERVAGCTVVSNKLRVGGPSVLVSRLNPRTNRTWFAVPDADVSAACSTEFLVLTPRENLSLGSLWLAVRGEGFRSSLSQRATGTSGSHQRVRPQDALSIEVADARRVRRDVAQEADALLQLVHQRRVESRMLTELRDTLLPELLSGRIRVPEAGEAVESALA
jgi:type I restriction enzyme S subunit